MRRRLLVAAAAIVTGALLTPAHGMPAHAMMAGTASALQAAADEAGVLTDVAYVCRHRYYSSRRVCWWEPGRRWRYHHWRRYRW